MQLVTLATFIIDNFTFFEEFHLKKKFFNQFTFLIFGSSTPFHISRLQ